MAKHPVMLIVLDGWGIGKEYEGNAIYLANTPNFNRLLKEYPNSVLEASGSAVGLPNGQMGNSEVGHLNIGSGRVVYQELTRITRSIYDGDFFDKAEFLEAVNNAKNNDTKLHIMGLVSDGGVHSHNVHLYALLKLCAMKHFKDVYIHAFLDGRDVPPTIGKRHLIELQTRMNEIGIGRIATVMGRYYSMDRDKRWDRVKLAYDAMVLGKGQKSSNAIKAVQESYDAGINDEFVIPTIIAENEQPTAIINNGDSIIFFNFRPDRARQITRAIVDGNFGGFTRTKTVDTYFVTMTEYDRTIKGVHAAYKPESLNNTLGEYISSLGLNQLRIAETEKYAHVTFFLNGGVEEPYKNEDRMLIPSPEVATYDLKPEMSAIEVKNEVLNRLNMDKYDLLILNFANPDMVGHTGVLGATIKAIEVVDDCLGEIVNLLIKKGGRALITSDHGNAEALINENDKNPITAHTTNKVPLIMIGDRNAGLKQGILADIAPTLLEMMGLTKPKEMTGQSLIKE